MSSGSTLHGPTEWKERVQEALTHRLVLVVGAGMSCWRGADGSDRGVWGVGRVLEALKVTLSADNVPGDAYGQALEKLKGSKGARAVGELIRRAVLAACRVDEADPDRRLALTSNNSDEREKACRRLEKRANVWDLPPGITALAQLLAGVAEQRKAGANEHPPPLVVTTNFDPLLEIALRAAGVEPDVYDIVNDEHPRENTENIAVWHVHGFWSGVTMHTPAALQAYRPKLKTALWERLKGADVCVLGYGGWQDIVFTTVGEILEHDRPKSAPEVLWAFRAREAEVRKRNAHVFEAFEGPLAACQASFYEGVSVHELLPSLVAPLPSPVAPNTGEQKGQISAEKLPDELRELFQKLIEHTPERLRPRLERLLARPNAPSLNTVAAEICLVLEKLFPEERDPFRYLARVLIERWSHFSARRVEPIRIDAGEPVRAPVMTLLLIEILMARAQERELRLEPHPLGARGRDSISEARGMLPAGPTADDYLVGFCGWLWRYLPRFKDEGPYEDGPHREKLLGHLEQLGTLGRRVYVVLTAGMDSKKWSAVAKDLPQVTFIEPAEKQAAELDFRERELAHHITEFLKLAFPEETSQ